MFTLLGNGISYLASFVHSTVSRQGSGATPSTCDSTPTANGHPQLEPSVPVPVEARVVSNAAPVAVPRYSVRPGDVFDETRRERDGGRSGIPSARAGAPADTVSGTGIVTVLEEGMSKGVIDGLYFFEKNLCGPEIKQGKKVNFRASLPRDSLQWEVESIKPFFTPEELEIKDLRRRRTFPGQVIDIRQGLLFLKYGKTNEDVQDIPLQAINLGYMPWLGDYLSVTVEINDPDSESTAGRILSVEPTSKKTVIGHVQQNRFGVTSIDRYIYFDQTVCRNERMPRLRDCVCAVAVESAQDRGYFHWRAVSVAPSRFASYTSGSKESEGWLDTENTWSGPLLELQNDKFGVRLLPKKLISFGAIKVGSSLTRNIDVDNTSREEVSLRAVIVRGDQSVCKFKVVELRREAADVIATIRPHGTYSVQIECLPAMLGTTRELCIFDFGTFRIGRYLTVTALSVQEEILNELRVKEVNGTTRVWKDVRSEETVSKMIDDSKRPVVRGIQPVRSPFFIQKRLEDKRVPKYMWTIMAKKDEVGLVKQHPGVAQTLEIRNYEDKFQVSLWLEEMENDILRRQYDLDNVVLRRAGDYFTFEAPGLKDYHPPILIGDPISVYDNSSQNSVKYEAFVNEIRGNSIFARFDEQFKNRYDGTYVTVEFRLGRTTYRRSHHAVSQAVKFLGEDWLFPEDEISCKPPRIPFFETEEPDESVNGSIVNALGYQEKESESPTSSTKLFPKPIQRQPPNNKTSSNPFTGRSQDKRLSSLRSPFKSDTEGPQFSGGAMELSWFNKKLNQEQKDAVRRILRGQGRPTPYIIFGPPGTGKTVTVVEGILQVHKLDSNSRILVVAPSNSAADVIAEHLVSSKYFTTGGFVRLVGFMRQEAQIPESIRDFCSDGESLDIVARNRIIVCTCTTAGQFFNLGLNTGHFTHVFVDEAGYCTEPEAIIASVLVALDKAGQVILAGDPKQLGPVLMSDVASKLGLSLSFLERLMLLPLYSRNPTKFPDEKYNPVVLTKLVKNYRAHPTLLKLPSKLFYDDELESAAAEENTNLCHSLDFMKGKGVPLMFHGIQGRSARDADSPSWFNAAEIMEVVTYVQKLTKKGVSVEDIGIITPYRKQVTKLRVALAFGLMRDDIPKVGSVEEFQGGERKVMIMSLVRSVPEKDLDRVIDSLAFVYSPKRFNVAITRAKAVLIVIGNPHMLHQDPNWSAFLRYCIELGCYTGCDLPMELDTTAVPYLESLEPSHYPTSSKATYDSDGEVMDSESDD